MADHLHDCVIEVCRVVAQDPLGPERLGQFHEIGQAFGPAVGIALAMQQFLPLAHHTEAFVVQDELFHRQVELHRGAQFLHVHQPRRLTRHIDHQRVRMAHLHADGRRKAVAHRAQTPGGHPAVRVLKAEILRRPHLVLAHFGTNVAVVIPGQRLKPLQRVLRLDGLALLLEVQAVDRFPFLDLRPPLGHGGLVRLATARLPDLENVFEHVGHIADNRNVGLDHLVDRRRIDVDMRLFRFGAERIEPSGDAVVKPGANVDHQIAIVHRHVGLIETVHAQHAHPVLARGRVGAKAHKGRRDRKARCLHQLAQELAGGGAGIDHAAAGIEDRALGRFHGRDQFGDLFHVSLQPRLIMRGGRFGPGIGPGCKLHVFRNVDQHRPRASGCRHVKCFVKGAGQGVGFLHQPVVFGAGAGDAHGVGLLKGVRADHERGHLAGQHDDRDRIHQCVRQARDRVRRAWPGCHETHARLARGARISFRGMHRTLFMAHEDVLDRVLLKDLVINR